MYMYTLGYKKTFKFP